MSEPPTKRRRMAANPYLDLEAVVDGDSDMEENDSAEDDAFIDDSTGEHDDCDFAHSAYQVREELFDFVRREDYLDTTAPLEEEDHAGLLHELLQLDLRDSHDTTENPLLDDDANQDDEEAANAGSVPRPPWREIAYVNTAVRGPLNTGGDDDPERRIESQDSLYEVSCQPGMEETIAFQIFSWAMQVDTHGPTQDHVLRDERLDASNLALSHDNIQSPGSESTQKRVVLARSAIANPLLRGRVYIESAKIGYVQRLARRVRGLNPASVRPVPRELLLRPLLITRRSFPDRTFVRLLDPPCPTMTCLIVKDYLLIVPRSISSTLKSPSGSLTGGDNLGMGGMPDLSSDSRLDGSTSVARAEKHLGSKMRVDQHGFRYLPLKKLSPSSLEPYEPSVSEVRLLFEFGRLNNRHYSLHMTRIMAFSLSVGDRVVFREGTYDQLVGIVLQPGNDSARSIYVPSQGCVVEVDPRQLRRHFQIGDFVSATTDDVAHKLGSRVGWVVGAAEGTQSADQDPVTGKLNTQGMNICVYSPESCKEVIAAHYEFQFEDTSAVSLLTTHVSPVSEVTLGRPYTLTISLHGSRGPSFFGIITAIDGIHSRHCGTEASSTSEPSASAVFSIWNRNTEAPFGYSPDWTETTEEFTEYNIQLGDTVTLKDRDGRCGTARIASLGGRELNLTNFTGALKFSDLESFRRTGPYDEHQGKTVCVVKGPYKGGVGIVKTVNAVGICTVELNIQPIRQITVSITCLRARDESQLYLGLVPILSTLPARAQTPPAPAPSTDTPPAFQISALDVIPDLPHPQQLGCDCSWLAQPFAQQLPIKLEPINRKVQRPYHFLNTFYDNAKDASQLMVRVSDRKNERVFAADKLKWLPASDINQTVVRITGENANTLYWTVIVDPNSCQVREVPSRRGATLFTFPRLELAQVNAKRK